MINKPGLFDAIQDTHDSFFSDLHRNFFCLKGITSYRTFTKITPQNGQGKLIYLKLDKEQHFDRKDAFKTLLKVVLIATGLFAAIELAIHLVEYQRKKPLYRVIDGGQEQLPNKGPVGVRSHKFESSRPQHTNNNGNRSEVRNGNEGIPPQNPSPIDEPIPPPEPLPPPCPTKISERENHQQRYDFSWTSIKEFLEQWDTLTPTEKETFERKLDNLPLYESDSFFSVSMLSDLTLSNMIHLSPEYLNAHIQEIPPLLLRRITARQFLELDMNKLTRDLVDHIFSGTQAKDKFTKLLDYDLENFQWRHQLTKFCQMLDRDLISPQTAKVIHTNVILHISPSSFRSYEQRQMLLDSLDIHQLCQIANYKVIDASYSFNPKEQERRLIIPQEMLVIACMHRFPLARWKNVAEEFIEKYLYQYLDSKNITRKKFEELFDTAHRANPEEVFKQRAISLSSQTIKELMEREDLKDSLVWQYAIITKGFFELLFDKSPLFEFLFDTSSYPDPKAELKKRLGLLDQYDRGTLERSDRLKAFLLQHESLKPHFDALFKELKNP